MVRRALYEIVYEDERIIAVNKASGVAVGAERWDPAAPRLDKLLRGAAGAEGLEIYTVHRIDKETSGLVVFARDRETHRALSSAFEGRGVVKTYIAVVHGRPAWPGGRASGDLPLKPEGNKRHMTIVDKYQGKPSFTAFRLILSAGNYSLVEALPKTGRTHQIRVHLASLGHPVVCDPLYGKTRGAGEGVYLSSFKRDWRGGAEEERPLLSRLGLHAAALTLPPAFAAAGVPPRLCAPLPRDMAALTRQMEKYGAPRAPE